MDIIIGAIADCNLTQLFCDENLWKRSWLDVYRCIKNISLGTQVVFKTQKACKKLKKVVEYEPKILYNDTEKTILSIAQINTMESISRLKNSDTSNLLTLLEEWNKND